MKPKFCQVGHQSLPPDELIELVQYSFSFMVSNFKDSWILKTTGNHWKPKFEMTFCWCNCLKIDAEGNSLAWKGFWDPILFVFHPTCYDFPSLSGYVPSFSLISPITLLDFLFHLFLLSSSIFSFHASRPSYLWLVHLVHLISDSWTLLMTPPYLCDSSLSRTCVYIQTYLHVYKTP